MALTEMLYVVVATMEDPFPILEDSPFSVRNIPFGIFSTSDNVNDLGLFTQEKA
jgi:hypothetical protein